MPDVYVQARSRHLLDEAAILPSLSDNDHLFLNGVNYIKRFLINYFPAFSQLRRFCPTLQSFKVPCKPEISPLEILDVNEGCRDGNIRILDVFASDLGKKDDTAVVCALCYIRLNNHHL